MGVAAGTRLTVGVHHARDRGEAQPQKMAPSLQQQYDAGGAPLPLRVIENKGFPTDIDWTNPSLVAGLVNIEGFDRATRRWNDIWIGGSRRADLNVDGGYVKLQHDLSGSALTFIASTDRTHAWYEEDNTGNGNLTGGVNHDVLIIDMDQGFRQYTGELRLASTDDAARLRWITGLYYLQEDALLAQNIRFGANGFPGAHPSVNGAAPFDLIRVIPNPYGNTDAFSVAKLEDKSYSAYAQGDLKFTDKHR